jgi:predicted enzyme related to lactoylglutathione lyase
MFDYLKQKQNMTINHLNLVVTDVNKAVLFFENYFEFTCEHVKGDNVIAVLKNKEDFVLVLMSAQMNKNGNSLYPDAFHIGFMVATEGAVDSLHQKLTEGKNEVPQAPGKIRDSYGFYFHFDNLFIEVGHYLTS